MDESGNPVRVVLVGGPAGGQEHSLSEDAQHLDVTMPDESRHRYNRLGCLAPSGDGIVTFEWSGRLP